MVVSKPSLERVVFAGGLHRMALQAPIQRLPREVAKTESREASQCDALLSASQWCVRRFFMIVPRDMSERSFSYYRVLQGDCLKPRSFTGFRHSENVL